MDDMLAGDDYVDEDEDEDEDTDFEKVGLKLPTHTHTNTKFLHHVLFSSFRFCFVHFHYITLRHYILIRIVYLYDLCTSYDVTS